MEDCRLSVCVTPRAARTAVKSYEDGVLHLRLFAPPVEGAANEACCAFVADLLNVGKGCVSVCSGHKSRAKVLMVTGLSPEGVRERLTPFALETSGAS